MIALRWGDRFLQAVLARGKVLYENAGRRVGRRGANNENTAKQ
jgi:hypothetical protein